LPTPAVKAGVFVAAPLALAAQSLAATTEFVRATDDY
jgi:hypothetical protein